MKPVRIAVLPVAGFGTRVLPASKSIPKELLPVVDQPVLQYVYDEAIEAGIEHIVCVTGRGKGAIEDYFDTAFELEASLEAKGKTEILSRLKRHQPKEGTVSFVRQQAAKGLGHAVWCARDIVRDEPFAVLLPDVIIQAEPGCLAQMMKAYQKTGGNIIAVDEIPRAETSSYGVVSPAPGVDPEADRAFRIDAMVEKPAPKDAPSNLKITGRYILQPEVMGLLRDQEAGAGGEIQLTDAMAKLMRTDDFFAYRYEGRDYDCGSKTGYLEAVLGMAKAHPEISDAAMALIRKEAAG